MNFKIDSKLLLRRFFLMSYDIVAIISAIAIALLLRYDFVYKHIDKRYIDKAWSYLLINIITTIVIFYLFRLYSSLWSFAGVSEMQNTISACILSSILQFFGMTYLSLNMPRSFYFLYCFILTGLTLSVRFAYRAARTFMKKVKTAKGINVMIVGAGESANVLISEIINSENLDLNIKCLIDDDPVKMGQFIHGIKVVGSTNDIIKYVDILDINQIIIAMPSVSKTTTKRIVDICKETKCELKILPGIYQLVNGDVKTSNLRNVEIEDLLGRESVKAGMEEVKTFINNKTVLVTGGGGSIGSELCRQIAKCKPKKLIIVDIYENSAYEIQQELHRNFPDLNLVVLIASVRNSLRIEKIFDKHRPEIVYHAAAHKHVPLMEESPNEAIKNNVFGTLKVVMMADKFNVEKFVLISTDKAVNPTNIMGASKRICEMIVQSYNSRSKTDFAAVRFGNVLGSNGSVIPLFKKQIETEGCVYVTHPDIVRYFMTIPEAVSLVLQTGVYAKGGEIFVLDMGEPVKILDLAINLIKLSGYVPYEEIKIEFTGLRPGEKIYEELLLSEEGLEKTENEMIFIGRPIQFDENKFWNQISDLRIYTENESKEIKEKVAEIVTTYKIDKKNNIAVNISSIQKPAAV